MIDDDITIDHEDDADGVDNRQDANNTDQIAADDNNAIEQIDEEPGAPAPARPYTTDGEVVRHRLQGMYQGWFLEYASYVILERAVPHIDDGLKPVQRRILHSMKTLEDGRYNKVANIVGDTMRYHPHGDASIKDALVQLGQKEMLIDTQGNWGNILTGASAAAGRYIEARLAPFALEVLYSPKVTEWMPSYDGRKKEPVTLPVKFPLLLAQGAEGIAVGLSSKILPHNVNELLYAAVAYLRGEKFELYPDFPTGGFIDVSKYNDGERGGSVKIRAKIEKIDNRTLAITEIPYGKTTGVIMESIVKAYEKNKIKIRKVEDLTAQNPHIQVHLQPGTSSDRTIDALYAFTDCEVSISPNCCVIRDNKPHFLTVSEVLKYGVDRTVNIFEQELNIKLGEVRELLMFASLEKYFIEKRIYKKKEYEEAPDIDSAVAFIDNALAPIKKHLVRDVTRDDILRLLEIRMKRILRFNADEADRLIAGYNEQIAKIQYDIEHIIDYTINWYEHLKEKYGEAYPRRTQLRNFDSIQAATVAEATEKLYFNAEEGFVGTALKKDKEIGMCSSLDELIIFYKDGRYKIIMVADKVFVGKGVIHIAVFKRNDARTIYNVIYQDGKGGNYYMKRFSVTGVNRNTEYNVTRKTPGSRICWFTANPNGEADIVKVTLKPKPRLAKLQFDVDFSKMAIKGRGALGNLVTKNEVHRFTLKEKGASTLGGRKVWFDNDVLRINYDGRGEYLGEFSGSDLVLVVLKNGEFYTSTFEATNHYEDNILRIEKFRPGHIYTAILNDADKGYPYIKRFNFEASTRKQRYLGDNPASSLIAFSDQPGARFRLTFGGADHYREPVDIDAASFIDAKSFKAKGKRLTTWQLDTVTELEPNPDVVIEETQSDEVVEAEPETPTIAEKSDDEVRDEINGQERLFD